MEYAEDTQQLSRTGEVENRLHGEVIAREEIGEGEGIEPADMLRIPSLFEFGIEDEPFPPMQGEKGIGCSEDQQSSGFQVAAHIADESAGIIQVFDEFCGDDDIEGGAEVCCGGVAGNDVISALAQFGRFGIEQVQAEGGPCRLDDMLMQPARIGRAGCRVGHTPHV